MLSVREASPDEIALVEEVSRVLAYAFVADPLIDYVFPAVGRLELTRSHFEPIVRAGLLYGRVIVTEPRIVGAAVAMAPGKWDLSEEELETAGFGGVRASIGDGPFERFTCYVASMQAFHRQDLASSHWYIALLGVMEKHRRQGIGTSLLGPLLAQADADDLPTYLETATEKNLPLYGQSGFEVVRQGMDAVSGVPYWTMVREPQGHRELPENS